MSVMTVMKIGYLLIVNDGSTDRAPEIIDILQKRFSYQSIS